MFKWKVYERKTKKEQNTVKQYNKNIHLNLCVCVCVWVSSVLYIIQVIRRCKITHTERDRE